MPNPLSEAVTGAMAEQAYGPIYSAQYADAMKSAQANKVARNLGLPADVVEADYPNMLASDRLQKAMAEARKNPVYGQMMASPRFAATAIDDPHVPEVARATAQLRNQTGGDRSSPFWRDRVRRYGYVGAFARSLRDTIGSAGAAAGQGLAGLGEMGADMLWDESSVIAQATGIKNRPARWFHELGNQYAESRKQASVRYDNWYVDQAARGFESIPLSLTSLLLAAKGKPKEALTMMSSVTAGQSYAEARTAGLDPVRAMTYAGEQGLAEAAGEALPIFKYADDALKGSGVMKRLGGQLLTENMGEQLSTHLQDFNSWAMIDANQGKTFEDYVKERPMAALETAVQATAAVGVSTTAAHGVERFAERVERKQQEAGQYRFLDKLMGGAAKSQARTADPEGFREALASQLDGTVAENLHVPAEAVRSLFQSADDVAEDPFWGAYYDDFIEADQSGGDVIVPLAAVAAHLSGTPGWEAIKDMVRLSPGGSSRSELAQWQAEFDDANRAAGEELAAMLGDEIAAQEPVQRVYEAMRDKLMHAGHTADVASQMATQFAHRQRTRASRLGQEMTGNEADVVDVVQVLPPKLAGAIKAAEVPDKGLSEVIAEMKRGRGERSDKTKFGPSLADFIRSKGGVEDPGGDLASMGAGKVKGVAKKGQFKIIRETGEKGGMFGPSGANANSLDNMALLAWEAGYFPEHSERPTVNDLLDALGEEVNGRGKRYAADNSNDADQIRAAAQELYALLDQEGLDPDTASPRQISEAVKRYQEQTAADGRGYQQLFDDPTQPSRTMTQAQRAELEARQKQSMSRRGGQQAVSDQEGGLFSAERDQRSLFQSGQTETPEFKAWFGDSKVVDENGKPLVVYHGTESDFTTFDPEQTGKASDDGWFGKGLYFAPNAEAASRYATVIRQDPGFGGDAAKGSVMPVYVRAENPYRTDVDSLTQEEVDGLRGQGYDAIFRYDRMSDALPEEIVAFEPTQIKSATGNRGTFDPNDPSILNQSYEDGARGRITFTTSGPNIIELFEKRDLSTFIHETGHLYLEELRADAEASFDAATPEARQLFADWEAVKAWFKREGHPIGEDGVIPTEAHEMWARGFERWTMEGKAPSTALRRAFEAFKSWMISIYKTVDALRSPITPEIRDVFSRLMATDEEIEAARAEQEIKALFTDAVTAGMTESEFAEYQRLSTEARDDAFDALLKKTMNPIRAARTKEHREREAAVRAEVAADVDGQPVHRAIKALRTGIDGQKTRLDRQWLLDTYGPDILDELPKGVPPVFASDGTLDADAIAEQTGFSSGDEMVRTLIGYEDARKQLRADGDKRSPRQVMIDETVRDIMSERYGDPLNDGSIEDEAMALIHNERQGEVIAAEVRALGKQTNKRPTPYAIARKWAREKIRGGTVSETASGAALQGYQRNARNAAKAAEKAMLAHDKDEAFRQKQAQMLNSALIAEGKAAKDEIEAAVVRLAKTARRRTAKSIDQDYLDQAHSLLENVEMRQRSQRAIDKQRSFEEWASQQRANGVDMAVPQGFAEHIGKTHWSRLSVDDLLGLDAAVRQILHLGRLKQTLLDGQERRQRDEVIAEMRATADGLGGGGNKATDNDPKRSFLGGLKSKFTGADAAMLKVEQLVDWLDRGNPNGIWNRMLFKPLADAQGREADMMRDYIGRLNEALAAMQKKQLRDWRRRVDTPELINRIEDDPGYGQPWGFYKDQVVMMALNWGNEGNRQRLMDGYGWSEAQVDTVLDRLMTPEDWQFVQTVWDTIDGLWPEVEALERRVNGVAPDKIEATPVTTQHGTFRGGYFPAVYDPRWSSRTDEQEAENLLERGYVRANVLSSATKARAAQVRRPILLSMDVITRHLGEVIHDITHREALTEAWRLASDERVHRIMSRELGADYAGMLRPWLKHIANDQARNANSNSAVVSFLRGIAHRVTIVGLGYRLTSVLAQVAGIPAIIAYVGERRVAEGWGRFLANPVEAYNEVTTKSSEMRDRFSTMDRDIVEMARNQGKRGVEAIAGPGWFTKYALHGILAMDAALTTAGWIGAYRKGLAEGMAEEEAIYSADKVVRKSQGAGGAKDQAAITREHQAVKLFTMFFSYFSALYNQQRDFAHRLRRAGKAKDIGRAMHFGFWALVMPPLVDALIRNALGGSGPGDDDDDETWGAWAAQRVIFGNFASLPGVRDIGGAIDNGFGYKATPVSNIGDALVQGWGNVKKSLDGDDETEVSSRWVKQTMNLMGLMFAKPTGQIGNAAQFGYDWAKGDTKPKNAKDVVEGVTTGKVKEDAS